MDYNFLTLTGFGKTGHISDVFYVKYDENDTVDHCRSLMDCDAPIPKKHHLIRRHHPYELSGIVWGPTVEKDGMTYPTLVMSFEDDDVVGVLLEQFIFDFSKLELEPLWENNVSSDDFLVKRYVACGIGIAVFVLGILLQHYWLWKQKQADPDSTDRRSHIQQGGGHTDETFLCMKYKNYILGSAVINSCILGGVVFGFPALVLILRQEGVYAEVCSCGHFCSGQREQIAMLSTIGFASAIGSRLFFGVFLDKFGPKITSTLAGLSSTTGFLLLATAKDSDGLSRVIQPAWIILALGGAAIHLTSFHTTNLQLDKAHKGQASVYISAGFGAGSIILPILQLINQYSGVSLQVISACYAAVTVILTINCFLHQPWRAWNALGSSPSVDMNCFRRLWWPQGFDRLSAIKKPSDAKFPPLNEVLMSFQFWGECFWFSGSVFLLTYYLSTISQILFTLGDAKVDDDVDNFANNIFTRIAVFMNGLGFLWAPTVAYLQKTKSIYYRVCLEITLALIACVLLTIPIIEVQIVVFIIQAFVRLQTFTYHL